MLTYPVWVHRHQLWTLFSPENKHWAHQPGNQINESSCMVSPILTKLARFHVWTFNKFIYDTNEDTHIFVLWPNIEIAMSDHQMFHRHLSDMKITITNYFFSCCRRKHRTRKLTNPPPIIATLPCFLFCMISLFYTWPWKRWLLNWKRYFSASLFIRIWCTTKDSHGRPHG